MEQKEQNLAAEQELTQAELSELLQIRRDKLKALQKTVGEMLAFCGHVPLLCVSALTRKNLAKILPLALQIKQECGIHFAPACRCTPGMQIWSILSYRINSFTSMIPIPLCSKFTIKESMTCYKAHTVQSRFISRNSI